MKRWISGVLADSGGAWWFLVFDGVALLTIGLVVGIIGLATGNGLHPAGWLAVGVAALMIVLGMWLRKVSRNPDA